MKKLLITGALILAIASSLVAGTLATYTKTLAPINGNVETKQFYIGTKETYFPDIKLAPSEKSEWTFNVVNYQDNDANVANEVDTDLNIALDVNAKEGKAAIDGLNVSIYDENNNQLGTTVIKNGHMSFNVEKAFLANTKATKKFKLVADWKNTSGDNVDTLNAENNNSTSIGVTVTGTQCIH